MMNVIQPASTLFALLFATFASGQAKPSLSADSANADSVLLADFNRLRETIFSLAPGVSTAPAHYEVLYSARFAAPGRQFPMHPQPPLTIGPKKREACHARGLCTYVKRQDYTVHDPRAVSLLRFALHIQPAPVIYYYGERYLVVEDYHPGIVHGELVVSGYYQVWFLEKVVAE